jgi:hypothetical protein
MVSFASKSGADGNQIGAAKGALPDGTDLRGFGAL